MFKRCGALVLGLLALSSASFAQCRNVSPAQYGVQSGAYYDARTGGRFVNPNGNYGAYPQVSNNVRVYQDQLNQSYQVNAYNQYNAYNPAYGNAYGYGNNYATGYNQVTVTPQYSPNQVGYVGVNPWNGYAGQSYNGYNYGQMNGRRGNNCRPQNNAFNNNYGRFWINR
jgi:hypothetical protein